MSSRLERLTGSLAERELDLLLVTDPVNVRWLTGFTGTSGLCLVGDGTSTFVTDFRYEQQAADQLDGGWEIEIAMELLDHAAKGLTGPLRLGVDDSDLSVKAHGTLLESLPDGVEAITAGGIVERLREIKDAGELAAIRSAAELADQALDEVLGCGLAGRTEREVALDLEFTMRRLGAQGVSFPPIVASGRHGALPHAEPRDVEIPVGTLCVIDWGAQLDGYASDCTRTLASGDLGEQELTIYELVLGAQLHALDAVEPGIDARSVDAAARDIIAAGGHGEHFGHGLGHGVGAEVHEAPRVSQRSDAVLRPGHVVTIEPGVYVPGLAGVRIEDLVFVTETGHEVVTHLSKELRVV